MLLDPPQSEFWAEIILPLALPNVYTYSIPSELVPFSKPGCRAEVIFGKNKKYAGIIKAITQSKPSYPTKPILNILDTEPILYPQQLLLWEWVAAYYMCSEGEVMAASLPANFKLNSEANLIFDEEFGDDFSNLNDEEFIVAEALLIKKQLHINEVQQLLDNRHVYPVIKNLIDKKVCFIWEQLQEKYKPKIETFISLHPEYSSEEKLAQLLNNWKGAPKQIDLLLAFLHFQKTHGEVLQSQLLKKSNATAAQLKSLCDKHILIASKRNVDRIQNVPKKINIDFTLSPAQDNALTAIRQSFADKQVCLLHGVTGSGKTLLYIRLIEDCIKKNKQVLYLLPEIALTTQIIRRLQQHFGGHIGVYHSKFNDQERVELWNKIKNLEVSVVLGARSAVFLPFNNLGLIIVDEEHDASFKQQDPAPRYNARDTAIFYASLFKANVLLGSGTPSLESYSNAIQNKYGLVGLMERFGGIQLPEITLVNTLQQAQKGKVMISDSLADAMSEVLKNDKQVILFQNRRGYNPYMICGSCGFIPQCKNCDVSLTLHKYSNKLHCHYCGSLYPLLPACIACGSHQWMEKNFGTEKVEEQLENDFSKYKVARMDVDSVRGKKAHELLIQQFEQHQLDILVGTQMVVKGLDFEKVSLVGILDADGLLSFADFRVNERAFQLMEQVSGRAGRKGAQGKVIIQTSNARHPVLKWVQNHDFNTMYQNEMIHRKEFSYPPFSRLIQLTLKHVQFDLVNRAAAELSKMLQADFMNMVVGPAQPVIGRIRNQFLMEVLLKLPKENGKIATRKKAIQHHINLLCSQKQFKSVSVIINVDPL